MAARKLNNYQSKHAKQIKDQKLAHILIAILLLIFIVSLVYFLFLSPVFSLHQISIIGASNINQLALEKQIYNHLSNNHNFYLDSLSYFLHKNQYQNNLFLMNTKQLSHEILNTMTQISSLSISKDLWNKQLVIKVKERQPVMLVLNNWQFNDSADHDKGSFYIDAQGFLYWDFKKSDVDYPIVYLSDISDETVIKDKKIAFNVFGEEKMDILRELLNYIQQEKIPFQYLEYSLQKPNLIILKTNENFDIYLNLNHYIVEAFKTASLFAEKHKINEYIDARYFPSKLFYK